MFSSSGGLCNGVAGLHLGPGWAREVSGIMAWPEWAVSILDGWVGALMSPGTLGAGVIGGEVICRINGACGRGGGAHSSQVSIGLAFHVLR